MEMKTLLAAVPLCAGLIFAQTAGQNTPAQNGTDKDQSTQGQDVDGSTAKGQSADLNRGANDHSIYGILVASGCNISSMNGAWSENGQRSSNWKGDLHRSDAGSADRTENSTTGDTNLNRTTSANPVDQSGSMPRGTQPGDMNRKTVGDRAVNNPQTGMADRERGGDTSATTGSQMADQRYGEGQQWESGAGETGQWDRACFISPTTTSIIFLTKDGRQVRLDDASNAMVVKRLSSTNRVAQKSKIFRVRVNGDMTGETLHIVDIQM
jgi:hypothetical protein